MRYLITAWRLLPLIPAAALTLCGGALHCVAWVFVTLSNIALWFAGLCMPED